MQVASSTPPSPQLAVQVSCSGDAPCKKEGALTTDEVYYDNGVTDGNLWPEVSLALGHYDGGTFVAA